MEIKRISEFKVGDNIEGFFLIKSSSCKTTNNNKNYLDMVLADNTGEINAKLWECSEEDELKYTHNTLIKLRGSVVQWQNKLQLRVIKIRLAREEDNLNIEDYILSAPENPEDMYEEIFKYINEIKNKDTYNIVSHIFTENKEKLMFYPAAKSNHHAMRSGLLYHILTMLRSAEKLCEVYTFLNKDLLYGGIVLHDIAKLDEMDANELGLVSDYTREGQLLGHIVQGIKKIEKVAEAFGADEEIAMLLEHMVLSHHYEPEFGSPVKPMIPEAEMLHYLDIIDSRMYDMRKNLNNVEKGDFSDRIWVLENRKLYKTAL